MKAVIIDGNFNDGYKVIGPFDTFDDAAECDADLNCGHGWITSIISPSDFLASSGRVCYECGQPFTAEEWEESHDENDHRFHDRCCPVCNAVEEK